MPNEFARSRRVAAVIKHKLAQEIQQQFPIHQYGLITLSAVDVSSDLQNARVYVTRLKEENDTAPFIDALNARAVFFRTIIAQSVTCKRVPKIKFEYDESIQRSAGLSALIDSLQLPKAD